MKRELLKMLSLLLSIALLTTIYSVPVLSYNVYALEQQADSYDDNALVGEKQQTGIVSSEKTNDEETRLLGDADGDGYIRIADVTVIQKYLAQFLVTSKFTESSADVDENGAVTIVDATCIQKYLAEYEITERIGCPIYDAERVIEYENGDTVFVPSEFNLDYNKEEGIVFYNNTLSVYLTKDISSSEEQRLANLCNGEVVGRIKGTVNVLQIKVTPTDFSTLESFSDLLMKENAVLYATYEFPMEVDFDADNNPWRYGEKNESDKGNESDPKGNDWWAEAIGAYSAWEYTDSGLINTPATVGVIDNGIDSAHEEFFDDSYKNKVKVLNGVVAKDHGTHVSGIIAANNNIKGIRGIADSSNLIFASFGDHETSSLTPSYAEIIKQMVNGGACVINMSWGHIKKGEDDYYIDKWIELGGKKEDFEQTTQTEKERKEFLKAFDSFKQTLIRNGNGYHDYEKLIDTMRTKTSVVSMILIIQLSFAKKDVLLVEASGNEYINVSNTGFFRAIDESLYNIVNEKYNNTLSKIMSYEEIRKHIMVVGAVENKREFGRYKVGGYSNWGDNIDLVAPGGNAETPWTATNSILSTTTTKDDNDSENEKDNNNGKIYGAISGTSMAAPMVTGSAALLKSLDPSLTSAEIKDILINKSSGIAIQKKDEDSRKTYPLLNIGRAAKYVMMHKTSQRTVADKHFIKQNINMRFYGEPISNSTELHNKILANPSGTFYLSNDIDFGEGYGSNWEMIPEFKGILYGNGYSIKNLRTNGDGSCGGMFRNINNAQFYDIGFEKFKVTAQGTGDTYVGTIAAFSDSSVISNCYVYYSGSGMLSASCAVGGFVGSATATDFMDLYTNQWFGSGSLDENYPNACVGGIAGECNGYFDNANHPFENCLVDSFFEITQRWDNSSLTGGSLRIGGIVGKMDATTGSPERSIDTKTANVTPSEILFSNCRFRGNIVGSIAKTSRPSCTIYAGGLIGYVATSWGSGTGNWSGKVRIVDSYVKSEEYPAEISAYTKYWGCVGGVIGYANVFTDSGYGVSIENTHFEGTLNASFQLGSEKCYIATIGGMIGYCNFNCLLDGVSAKGSINAKSEQGIFAGKFIGSADKDKTTISNYNTTITMNIESNATGSQRKIGGLIGTG